MVAGLLVVALIVVVDILLGPGPQLTGLFTTPAFVAAAFVRPWRTALVGSAALIANFVTVGQAGIITQGGAIARTAGVVAAVIGAVVLSAIRERDQRRILTFAHIAEVAQLAVLRAVPASVGPAHVAVRYLSASAQARVGGDFYEAVPTSHGMRALVGDVRGRGLGSAQLANVLIGAFRGADHDKVKLQHLAEDMDAAFARFEPDDEDFATAVLVELNPTGELTVVNCGHPAPLVVGQRGVRDVRPLSRTPPIGLGAQPQAVHDEIAQGERLLLFTDGIIEARAAGELFDLEAHAPALATGPLDEALDQLVATLDDFLGRAITDDVALMLLERA